MFKKFIMLAALASMAISPVYAKGGGGGGGHSSFSSSSSSRSYSFSRPSYSYKAATPSRTSRMMRMVRNRQQTQSMGMGTGYVARNMNNGNSYYDNGNNQQPNIDPNAGYVQQPQSNASQGISGVIVFILVLMAVALAVIGTIVLMRKR